MTSYKYSIEENLDVIGDVDVLVIGGGFGGVCAALAAADTGLKVALVEKNAIIGGQAAEIDTWGLDGFVNREGHLVVAGYPWKILLDTVKEGGSDIFFDRLNMDILEHAGIEAALHKMDLKEYIPFINTGTYMNPFNDQYIDANAYRYTLHKYLENAKVQIFLGMPTIDVVMKGEAVKGVIVQGEFGHYVIMAKRVVDTTQGASVCAYAGKEFAYPLAYVGTLPKVSGIEIKELIQYIRETDEAWFLRPMVGETADPYKMERLVSGENPLAIHGFMTALRKAVVDDPEYNLLLQMGPVIMFFYERDAIGSYWIIDDSLHNTDVSDPVEYSKALCTVRKQQWLMHKFFVNYIPGFEHAHLADTYANISKAYHQTMDASDFTEYTITEKEIQEGKSENNDVIVRILGHPMSGQNANGWYVPLQALIPRGLDDILVTGKPACRKIHYIASCALVGQAAGAAAAVSVIDNSPLRATDTKKIREALKQQGVLI